MKDEFETLKLTREGDHILVVTLNRPEASNAMNTQMGLDLMHTFERLQIEQDGLRIVVVTGAGDKAFCAGGDLKQRRGMTDEQWMSQHAIFERMLRALMSCPLPVMVAVNGAAYGGGCEFVAACDFVYASTNARFALTEVTLGIMPGAGGTQNLPRAMGTRRAMEVILTGAPFTAEQGEAWGLINKVTAPDKLMEEALTTARRIAANAPISVRQAKQSVLRGSQMSIWDGLAFEIEAYNRMVPTEDRREGVLAYNEKRKPNFRGR
ncbi:MAG: enoyl-CoA hydratase/isomerase family protein [Hyphomicrobiaceae bacterium]